MATDEVVVRLVRPGDAVALQANCSTQNTVEETFRPIGENLEGFERGTRVPLVAEVDGAAVGNALLIRDAHPLRKHRAGWYDVVVTAAYQRRGIARRLLAETLRQAAALGVEILETSARGGEPAEEVYRRLGFREWGRVPGGMHQSWGKVRVFDAVYFYLPVAASP
jgi:GNAT superfamily N-acetyltransferase